MQEINRIGVIIAGDEFPFLARFQPFVARVEHQIHRLPGQLKMRVILAVFIAAPAIVQMRQVKFVDVVIIH